MAIEKSELKMDAVKPMVNNGVSPHCGTVGGIILTVGGLLLRVEINWDSVATAIVTILLCAPIGGVIGYFVPYYLKKIFEKKP